jgi:hypothetical protein
MAYARTSLRREKQQRREQMRAAGLDFRQIAAEFSRVYRLRPRAAWREAYGWSLTEEAARINAFRGNTGIDSAGLSGMTAAHLSEYEQWPGQGTKPAGRKPSPYLLSVLAAIFDCHVSELIDSDDRAHLPPADLLVLDKYTRPSGNRLQAPAQSRGNPLTAVTPGRSEGGDAAPGPSPAIRELCAVLTRYGLSPPGVSSERPGPPPACEDLERDVRLAFDAYQQSRFTIAASRVSALLADTLLAARACTDKDRATALKMLALSHQAAASILTKAGEPDAAWIAAERGLNAAEAAGSTAVRGSLIRSVAFALLSTGRLEPAMALVDSGADHLHAQIAGDDTVLSVYGTLLLAGAMAAARFGDGPRTADYLGEAHAAALRLGKDANHLWTAFGPTNVAIHRVNTAVELGDIQTVLASGLSLKTDAVPAERRARYLLDVARVHTMTGSPDDALSAMLTAERIAPEQVRQHYVSRNVVTALMRDAPGKPGVQLGKLAKRVRIREWA